MQDFSIRLAASEIQLPSEMKAEPGLSFVLNESW